MNDRTQPQADDDQLRSRKLSLKGTRPPTEVPGYDTQQFLGSGAYGEVWVALDRNTQRRVAIKFYTHRGGVDWSLLSREVEKLSFLSADRYVVQLFDVGWNADPPYYVMEYLERGSLEDRIARDGPLPVAEAVALFREIAVGLLHAHGKGVLHCDLKPANVLLDEDSRPRLADFGQSRLSHEQTPALGTLFYMAPEQADLSALPDARWDVYALGAVFYAMLTGSPPRKSDAAAAEIQEPGDLEQRLRRYRDTIRRAPPPRADRQVPGIDRPLADIIDRSLAADPDARYPNVQAVLDALAARETSRQRRPLVVLGALAPALVLLVAAFFAWQWFVTVVRQSDRNLTERALEVNQFAAQFVARAAGDELSRRFRAVEQVAADRDFRRLLRRVEENPELAALRARLSDPAAPDNSEARHKLREELLANPLVRELEETLVKIRSDPGQPATASWFVTDEEGLQIARLPMGRTVGRNFAWRTYFNGRPIDQPRDWRPGPGEHITTTNLSTVFLSQASGHWIVGVSAPVYDADDPRRFLGVVALSVEVGSFVELRGDADRFGVLVDLREGQDRGRILQHPIYDDLRRRKAAIPDGIAAVRFAEADVPLSPESRRNYVDPYAAVSEGAAYRQQWLAAMEPVLVWDRQLGRSRPTGWYVVVQQSYNAAIGGPLEALQTSLVRSGLAAVVLVAIVLSLLWWLVIRGLGRAARHAAIAAGNRPLETPTAAMPTLPDMNAMRKR